MRRLSETISTPILQLPPQPAPRDDLDDLIFRGEGWWVSDRSGGRLIGKTALSSALCGRRPRFFFTFPGPSYIIVWLKSTCSPDFREFYKRE